MRGFAILLLLLVCSVNAHAMLRPKSKEEDKLIKKAQKYLNAYEFSKAEETFRKAIAINPTSFEANFQFGLYFTEVWADHEKALPFLQKATTCHGRDTVYELYYQLGTSYQRLGDYENAKKYYSVFKRGLKKDKNGDALAQVLVTKQKQCDFAATYEYKAFSGKAINLGPSINSTSAEYCAAFFASDSSILYTRRSENNMGEFSWDYQYHEDVYLAKGWGKKWSNLKPLQQSEKYKPFSNSDYHDAIVGNSITNDTVFLYKKNKLWYSTLKGDVWSEPVMLPKDINFGKHQRHACYAANAKTIIFSSDAKGGKGGFDLYSISKDANGNWNSPQNLGDKVNTTANEDSPYVTADGSRLYFSSKGHPGFGEYDIYYCYKENDGSWSKPVNVGEPFNSPGDDIYFQMSERDNGRIFFSSSRPGGYGNMDIYTFDESIEPIFGNCTEAESEKYVRIISVDTVDLGEEAVFEIKTKELDFSHYFWKVRGGDPDPVQGNEYLHAFTKEGNYTLEVEAIGEDEGGRYNFCVSKKITVYDRHFRDSLYAANKIAAEKKAKEDALAALNKNNNSNTNGNKSSNVSGNKNGSHKTNPDFPLGVGMDELEKVDVGMALENIYFDFDSQNVNAEAKARMEKNLEILRTNADVYVTIAGHTDSKGSNDYNRRLAERRAKATRAYLIKNGIDASRIVQVSSEGEEKPIEENILSNGNDNPDGRAKNRRVEFTVYRKRTA